MTKIMFFVLAGFILWAVPAQANFTQLKNYKEAYPGTHPKCINCHMDKIPKKAKGQHEFNAYGKAVIKAAGAKTPTADTYKKVGTMENFKK